MIAPLASPDVVAEAFRAEERMWHTRYRLHIAACSLAEHGWACCVCTALCDAADDAGKKVALAEARR